MFRTRTLGLKQGTREPLTKQIKRENKMVKDNQHENAKRLGKNNNK